MVWPILFSALASPGQLSTLDTMFNQAGQALSIPCTASGASTIVLTPAANTPPVTTLAYGLRVTWVQASDNTSTAVTINFNSLGAKPLCYSDTVTQIGTVQTAFLKSGRTYEAIYDSTSAAWFLHGFVAQGAANANILTVQTTGMPSWATFAPGMPTVLNTLTASASASVVDTTSFTATYNHYLFTYENILPANSDVGFWMRVSTDGGATYKATTYVSGCHVEYASTTQNNINATTQILLSGNNAGGLGITNTAGYGYSGWGMLHNPTSSVRKFVMGQGTAIDTTSVIGNLGRFRYFGYWDSGTAINACQWLMETGNITSGKVRIYGLKL